MTAKLFDFSTLYTVGNVETRQPGDYIFRVGEIGNLMYVVKSGEVQIKVHDAVVETVVAGNLLGEMALLDNAPRSADAVAATPCEIIPIDMMRFLSLVQKTPFFAIEVMRIMVRRLRAMNERVGSLRTRVGDF